MKGDVQNKWLQKNSPPYGLYNNEHSKIKFPDVLLENASKKIDWLVENCSDEVLKLKKGDYLGKLAVCALRNVLKK